MNPVRILPAAFAVALAVAPLGAGSAAVPTAGPVRPVPQSQILQGQFALQGQQPMVDAHLKVTPVAGKPLTEKLDLWMNLPGKPAAIQSYQVEMTKKLHMIFVRDDFKVFLHEHPVLGRDGHLLLTQTFPTPGTYLAYTDGLPNQMNHQVFRFEFNVGQPSPPDRNVPLTGLGVQAGPYEVDISSVRLHAGMMSTLDVAILKDGKPATDLHPYLGVPAHSVFLNARDLSYVHVHPTAVGQMMNMNMSGGMKPWPTRRPCLRTVRRPLPCSFTWRCASPAHTGCGCSSAAAPSFALRNLPSPSARQGALPR